MQRPYHSSLTQLTAEYRKPISPIVYVNLGASAGAIYTDYNWDYSDITYGINDPEE